MVAGAVALVVGAGVGTLVADRPAAVGQPDPSPVSHVDTVDTPAPTPSRDPGGDVAGIVESVPQRLSVRAGGGDGELTFRIRAAPAPVAVVLVLEVPGSPIVRTVDLRGARTVVSFPDLPAGEIRWRVGVVEGSVARRGMSVVTSSTPAATPSTASPSSVSSQESAGAPPPSGGADRDPGAPVGINDQPRGPQPATG